MSERTDQLMEAGMVFQPTPPAPQQEEEIDNLSDDQFNDLLALVGTLTQSPLFISYNQGLQQRTYVEP